MKHLNLPTVSMEAIQYQGRSLLLFDIVSAIEAIRVYPMIDQAALDQTKLADIIHRRTGLKVTLILNDDETDYSFYAEPPLIDAANPYFRLVREGGMYDAKKAIQDRHHRSVRMASDTMSWVDLKAGRVNGLFTQMNNRLFISPMMLNDRNFTSEEIAAVLLHELGHLFSYFETLAYTTASNMVITTAVEALQGTEDKSERLKLLTSTFSVFGSMNKEDIDVISSEANPAAVRPLMLKTIEEAEQSRVAQMSADVHNVYNTRSIEFMADQFAIRNGAALALANAQHKMAKLNVPDYGRSKIAFYSVQALRIALLAATWAIPVTGFLIGPLITLTVSLVGSFGAADGDANSDPGERVAQIKSDLVQLLKNTKLDPKMRKQILNDVEAIDALRAEIKEHGGVFRFIWRNVTPYGRRQTKIRDFQKGLEGLITNDLFLHASRLRGL